MAFSTQPIAKTLQPQSHCRLRSGPSRMDVSNKADMVSAGCFLDSLTEHGRVSLGVEETPSGACMLRKHAASLMLPCPCNKLETPPQQRLSDPVAHTSRRRRTAEGRAYGLSLMGVGAGSLIYHSSSGK